jgi:hypothetical protein
VHVDGQGRANVQVDVHVNVYTCTLT